MVERTDGKIFEKKLKIFVKSIDSIYILWYNIIKLREIKKTCKRLKVWRPHRIQAQNNKFLMLTSNIISKKPKLAFKTYYFFI